MSPSRRIFRIAVLAVLGFALTACHFHRHGCGRGYRYHAPVRICR